ncbi:MAG: 3-keto-disaccharide hydrolase, partial [Planctomycetota bacterium]
MKVRSLVFGVCGIWLAVGAGCNSPQKYHWEVHDKNRPQPRVISPGEHPADPPSDAIVLFDGMDLSQWLKTNGEPPKWKVENGYMEAVKKAGSIKTKRGFGDCQLHIEWATPSRVKGEGQDRGNSGVYLMGKYEVQVLDSYDNTTYADGQAAAVYGQSPPMVNACRGPGQWQSYDIIFRRPVFKDKKLVRPATITVLHNGVLVQDHWVIQGPTAHKKRAQYKPHEDRLPISLQDHGNPV